MRTAVETEKLYTFPSLFTDPSHLNNHNHIRSQPELAAMAPTMSK